jgi:hypothetical protein
VFALWLFETEKKNLSLIFLFDNSFENTLTNERHKRNLLFFNEVNGIMVLGSQVKANIRGAFGRTSSQNLQVTPFKFINRASFIK